ncbi:hypothetical protein [Actinophytocola oryzae]|nr:hypothetical protein [Actinophytocola oryzae]
MRRRSDVIRRAAAVTAALVMTTGMAAGTWVPAAAEPAAARWDVVMLEQWSPDAINVASFIDDRGVIIGTNTTAETLRVVRWGLDGHVVALDPTPPGTRFAWPTDLNSRGEVSGFTDPVSGTERPVRWDARGHLTVLPTLTGGGTALANGIADDGTVVGSSTAADGIHGHAVRWTPGGSVVDLGTLPGTDNSGAWRVSDHGVIVGSTMSGDGPQNGIRWSRHGELTDLGVAVIEAVNDNGDVVGWTGSGLRPPQQAVRWDARAVAITCETPSGESATAIGINNRGTAIGNTTYTAYPVALRWDRVGHVTLFATPPSVDSGTVSDINDRDEAVGTVHDAATDTSHAAFWDAHGVFTDLGVPPGFVASSAHAVDDRGDIIGDAIASDGTGQPVLWRARRHTM